MQRKLKLVYTANSRHAKRPIATHYVGAAKVARSTSIPNAIVSAVRKLIRGEYPSAQIMNATGNVVAATIYWDKGKLVIRRGKARWV